MKKLLIVALVATTITGSAQAFIFSGVKKYFTGLEKPYHTAALQKLHEKTVAHGKLINMTSELPDLTKDSKKNLEKAAKHQKKVMNYTQKALEEATEDY